MILFTEIQLGLLDQTILMLNDTGEVTKKLHVEMKDVPETLCAFYYTYDANQIIIRGTRSYCHDIANAVKNKAAELYADRKPVSIVIE